MGPVGLGLKIGFGSELRRVILIAFRSQNIRSHYEAHMVGGYGQVARMLADVVLDKKATTWELPERAAVH